MNTITAPAESEPLLRLWAAARALLAEMMTLFGAPSALTAHARLGRALRRALSPWVRSLEELVRKLLLAEAVAQMPCAARALRRPPTLAPLARSRLGSEIAASTRPRARFNLAIPRDERIVPDNRAPRIRALWNEPARPLPAAPTPRSPQRASVDRLALRFAGIAVRD